MVRKVSSGAVRKARSDPVRDHRVRKVANSVVAPVVRCHRLRFVGVICSGVLVHGRRGVLTGRWRGRGGRLLNNGVLRALNASARWVGIDDKSDGRVRKGMCARMRVRTASNGMGRSGLRGSGDGTGYVCRRKNRGMAVSDGMSGWRVSY